MTGFAEAFLGARDNAMARTRLLQEDQNKSALATLLGDYYGAPESQRQKMGAEIARRGGNPYALEAASADQKKRQMEELRLHAQFIDKAPAASRPVIWEKMRGGVARIVGDDSIANMPWDEATIMPVVTQLTNMGQDRQNLTPGMASIEDAYRRGLISDAEYKQALRVNFDLAPGASAPRVTYVDRFDPATGRTYKEPMLTSGVDYTGSAPSLAPGVNGGPQSAPQPRPSVAGEPDPEAAQMGLLGLVGNGVTMTSGYRDAAHNKRVGGADGSLHTRGQAGDFIVPQHMKAEWTARAEAAGFRVIDEGDHMHAQWVGRADPYANSAYLRTNIQDLGGGGAILSGPGYAENEAAKRREAAASAEGAIEGRRNMGPDFNEESSLRKEFSDLTKEPRVVIDAYHKVRAAADNDSAAGDLSLIFAYMKMLDPNSVVRETEFANAQNAAGVPDQVRNMWNRALTGERLAPNQRLDFVRQAETIATLAQTRIDETSARYREMAPAYSMDPDRIAPRAGRPQVGIVEDGYRYVGGDPGEESSWERVR